jgi:ADP-heptose:LPS heptosyltransferase/GT2 family glycosyltransferase
MKRKGGTTRRRNQEPAAPPPVDHLNIQVYPNMFGGPARDRMDVTIRGRIVGRAAVESVRLEHDGQLLSATLYGQADVAALTTGADGMPSHQRSFQFNVARPLAVLPAACIFRIVAHAGDGTDTDANVTVGLSPAAAVPVSLLDGPLPIEADADRVPPHGMMHLECACIDDEGLLVLGGWAVAFEPIEALEIGVDVDGTFWPVGEVQVGEQREDVAGAYPHYPHCLDAGFTLVTRLEPQARRAEMLRARLRCGNGFGLEGAIPLERVAAWTDTPVGSAVQRAQLELEAVAAGEIAVEAPMRVFKMFCDEAELTPDGMVSVNGWAVSDVGVAQIRVMLNDNVVGLAAIGHERTDVGAAYHDLPAAGLSGFRFEGRGGDRLEGDYRVRVIARNARNEELEQVLDLVVLRPDESPPPEIESPLDPTPEQAHEFRFQLDAPAPVNDVVMEPITGRLTIEGWLLSRTGIESFVVYLDDQRLGDALYGLARHDVGAAFPEWPNGVRSGFAFHCPPRSLRDGEHTVRMVIRAHSGVEIERSFRITVLKSDEHNDHLSIRRRLPRTEADMLEAVLVDLAYRPAYRLILRQPTDLDVERIGLTLRSLSDQIYPDWTALVLAETEEAAAAMATIITAQLPALCERFEIVSPADADRWQAPLADAGASTDPRFVGILGAGDQLGVDALLELSVAAAIRPGTELLYGDEVRPNPATQEQELEPFFKPDYAPDLLLSMNYIGRPWFASAALLDATGATPANLSEAGEYDLVLRCAEQAKAIHHLPMLLCQRAASELDGAAQERAALEAAMARRGIVGSVMTGAIAGAWRVRRTTPSKGKVSVIIPTCAAHGYIETCIKTFRERTRYTDYELIVIDNIPERQLAWKVWVAQNADKVVDIPDAFNWSVFNNRASAVADGEYLLFLNDDIEITQDDWLDAMLEHAQRPEVGLTGPRLLYPDGKIQHAGMFLATNGIGRHAFRFADTADPGYFGFAQTQRNVMAVTGACMLVRRDVFERLGRFDEEHQIVNNDLDFCLRCHKAGLLTVFTPYATLTHHELASRSGLKDVFNNDHFDSFWKTTFAAGDPYYNPRLSRHADDYRPDDEAVQWVTPGAPLFHVDEIKRILVVKLDHIGDFVTALPAIRRLKQVFPQASISVLAGPASRAFVPLEPCIDELIPFAFFHARSQLGERKLEQEDFVALGEQLAPYRFDLAVDLRKHPSTRDVLKYTGARYLAGYDYQGQFPFLDVALDWDGDRRLQRKRSHVIDDLIALVDAVRHATEGDRNLMQPRPAPMDRTELPADVQALFVRPVVAIHPGAGNVTKQWPTEHFSALIDLLIEREHVNVLMIGGPDEIEVVEDLLRRVLHPGAVASMAGKTPLSELPSLLLNCALYIGNDSGPKHIAAAVGIPTIGIHSGVVDPVEWGPLGLRAVALRRNMTCSPCYLANAEDCTRGLACLKHLDVNEVYRAAMMLLRPALARLPLAGLPGTPPARGSGPEAEASEIHVSEPEAETVAEASAKTAVQVEPRRRRRTTRAA